jgi:hypothetical protein
MEAGRVVSNLLPEKSGINISKIFFEEKLPKHRLISLLSLQCPSESSLSLFSLRSSRRHSSRSAGLA